MRANWRKSLNLIVTPYAAYPARQFPTYEYCLSVFCLWRFIKTIGCQAM